MAAGDGGPFPYEETVDQLRAAAEVKDDMERERRWTG